MVVLSRVYCGGVSRERHCHHGHFFQCRRFALCQRTVSLPKTVKSTWWMYPFLSGRAELDGEATASTVRGRMNLSHLLCLFRSFDAGGLAPMMLTSQRSGTARNADPAKPLPGIWGRAERKGASRERTLRLMTGTTRRTLGHLDSDVA